MKYYKITIGGKGAEVYPFQLNTEQYETLRDGGVEQDELDHDQICEILGVDTFFESPNESIIGTYPDAFFVRVEDEGGNVVYQSEDLDSDRTDYEEHIVYDIPLEEEFDINKLRFKVDDIGCRIEVVSGILYDEKDYNTYKSFGDTSSKGYYYHLTAGI